MAAYPRRLWGARKRRHHPGELDPRKVVGIALHWPGMDKPLRTVADVKAALRGWQDFHIDGRGWSDIAYQVAIDQAGNHYTLRGLRNRSAANGDTDLNSLYGAFLLILAPGEAPSEQMIRKVRRLVVRHRKRFPNSREIVGHGEIREGGTECPGAPTLAAIRAGAFAPA